MTNKLTASLDSLLFDFDANLSVNRTLLEMFYTYCQVQANRDNNALALHYADVHTILCAFQSYLEAEFSALHAELMRRDAETMAAAKGGQR